MNRMTLTKNPPQNGGKINPPKRPVPKDINRYPRNFFNQGLSIIFILSIIKLFNKFG